MLEMRSAVTHADRVGHADPLEFLALERDDIDLVGRGIEMQLQVDQRRGGVFDGRPALIEPARFEELVDERIGHRLAGFIVEREAAQHLRLQDPMLEDLRGELDEIAGDMGSGNARIDDVGQHAVQPWPNSWKSVRASSTLKRLASPSPPLAKFITLTTIGNCGPSSFCWPRKPLIHAPLRFDGLAK